MLRDGDPSGSIALGRTEVRHFPTRRSTYCRPSPTRPSSPSRTFGCSRRCRRATRDLARRCEQQTATADVLQGHQPLAFDLETVLATLIRTAIQLTDATGGVIWLRGRAILRLRRISTIRTIGWLSPRTTRSRRPRTPSRYRARRVHRRDRECRGRAERSALPVVAAHKLGDYRGGLALPLKRDGKSRA